MESGTSELSAGRRLPAGGKSMFSQTCNLLSQYLKENGKFGDPSFIGMGGSIKDVADTRHEAFSQTARGRRTTMDLLPLMEKSKNGDDSSEPETAQMTIFYGGQVLVFNDLTADKANEIMLLASNFSNSVNSSVGTAFSNINLSREQPSSPIPLACDLPVARKASLQRFLAKRKDRIAARSPYGIRKSLALPSNGKAWLELAACQSSKLILGDLDPNNAVSL